MNKSYLSSHDTAKNSCGLYKSGQAPFHTIEISATDIQWQTKGLAMDTRFQVSAGYRHAGSENMSAQVPTAFYLGTGLNSFWRCQVEPIRVLLLTGNPRAALL
jgi:hypothetical protein